MEIVSPVTANVSPRHGATHDLRALFGVAAVRRPMPERDPARARRIALLEAIEDAAARGGGQVSTLPGGGRTARPGGDIDIAERIAALRQMALALAGTRIALDIEVAAVAMPVRVAASDFDAALLDLIADAGAAEAGRIVLRVRRVGRRIWIMVADDGPGIARDPTRARHFVRAAHGQLRVRSRPGAGTMIALILPTVLRLSAGEDGAIPRRHRTRHEEKTHEDRQPVAA